MEGQAARAEQIGAREVINILIVPSRPNRTTQKRTSLVLGTCFTNKHHLRPVLQMGRTLVSQERYVVLTVELNGTCLLCRGHFRCELCVFGRDKDEMRCALDWTSLEFQSLSAPPFSCMSQVEALRRQVHNAIEARKVLIMGETCIESGRCWPEVVCSAPRTPNSIQKLGPR